MKHFVGLDVSMKETAVCVVDDHGQRIWEGSVASSADAIAMIIRQKAPDLVRAGTLLTMWKTNTMFENRSFAG